MVFILNSSYMTPVWLSYCPAPKLTSNPRQSSFSLYQPPADTIPWQYLPQSFPQTLPVSSWVGSPFLAHPL
jgi:hypothetical protein